MLVDVDEDGSEMACGLIYIYIYMLLFIVVSSP